MLLRLTRFVAPALPPPPYVAAATFLPAPSGPGRQAFHRAREAVQAALDTCPGLLRYSLQRQLFGRSFWTLTVWQDEAAMRGFVQASVHAAAMRAVPNTAEMGGRFTHWVTDDPLVPWSEAYAHLGIPPPTGRVLEAPGATVPEEWKPVLKPRTERAAP